MELPILSCCLHGPGSQPLDLPCPEYLKESARDLRDALVTQFQMGGIEPPPRCWLEIQLSGSSPAEDLAPLDRYSHSVEQVLKNLAGSRNQPTEKEPGKARIREQLLVLFPELEGSSQLDRMIQEAMEFSARGLGLNLAARSAAEAAEPRKRSRIFSCPDCDEVFISSLALELHSQVHRAPEFVKMLVQAVFELQSPRELSIRDLPLGISTAWRPTCQRHWEWTLEGRKILSGRGDEESARAELLGLLARPGLVWLGDAVLQKHLLRIESVHPGLLQHSLWQPGLTLRDVRRLLQRLDAAGLAWTDWLSFLEIIAEAIVECREEGSFEPGILNEVRLERLKEAVMKLSGSNR
ncbi:MAG: C2H2-type zinc finger protein [Vulcanimicrobiota bacterium]